MLDYTEGWAWFVSGATATLVVVLLLVLTAWAAGRSQRGGRRLR
jgi:hypothetical protein